MDQALVKEGHWLTDAPTEQAPAQGWPPVSFFLSSRRRHTSWTGDWSSDVCASDLDSGAVPHDTRWRLVLPARTETADYMRLVAERVANEVARPDAIDVVRHFTRYSVHHYYMHTEALTYTRQTLGMPAPTLAPAAGPLAVGTGESDATAGALPGDVEPSGGNFLLGALLSDPFTYDNEKWAHPVEVRPFAIAKAPVTQGEFAAFVDDGGYRDARMWSDGGAWLAARSEERRVGKECR